MKTNWFTTALFFLFPVLAFSQTAGELFTESTALDLFGAPLANVTVNHAEFESAVTYASASGDKIWFWFDETRIEFVITGRDQKPLYFNGTPDLEGKLARLASISLVQDLLNSNPGQPVHLQIRPNHVFSVQCGGTVLERIWPCPPSCN